LRDPREGSAAIHMRIQAAKHMRVQAAMHMRVQAAMHMRVQAAMHMRVQAGMLALAKMSAPHIIYRHAMCRHQPGLPGLLLGGARKPVHAVSLHLEILGFWSSRDQIKMVSICRASMTPGKACTTITRSTFPGVRHATQPPFKFRPFSCCRMAASAVWLAFLRQAERWQHSNGLRTLGSW
jgi:hypothetical protein